jgi:hypothetical protein
MVASKRTGMLVPVPAIRVLKYHQNFLLCSLGCQPVECSQNSVEVPPPFVPGLCLKMSLLAI